MKKGVLFLDDDRTQLFIYERIAKNELPEYPAYFASSVSKAEEFLKEKNIGVAVLDLMMPEENGADLIIKMKANKEYDDVKILVVSSAEKNSLIYDSLVQYIDGFMTKPIQHDSFSQMLLHLMNDI